MGNEFTSQSLAEAFAEHRARLMSFVERRLNPILLKRMSAEDLFGGRLGQYKYFDMAPVIEQVFNLNIL